MRGICYNTFDKRNLYRKPGQESVQMDKKNRENLIEDIAARLSGKNYTASDLPRLLRMALVAGEKVSADAAAISETLLRLKPEDYGDLYTAMRRADRKAAMRRYSAGRGISDSELLLTTGVYTPLSVAYEMTARAFLCLADDLPPEKITVMDPACGAGIFLLVAYRFLREKYLQAGAAPHLIPRRILENNLFGLDLDGDALMIAALALFCEARKDDPTLALGEITFHLAVPRGAEQNACGSLLGAADCSPSCFSHDGEAYRLLCGHYRIVLLNPPYMGKKGMPRALSDYCAARYPEGKTELYAAFILRAVSFLEPGGILSVIAIHSWLFLSSFAPLRRRLLTETAFLTVLHLGAGVFSELSAYNALSAVVVLQNKRPSASHTISFYDVTALEDADLKMAALTHTPAVLRKQNDFFSYASAPLLYMLPEHVFALLGKTTRLGDLYPVKQGLATGDNKRFVRFWHEPEPEHIGFGMKSCAEAVASGKRFFPYNKGGYYRKWYGMNEYVVDFADDGRAIAENRDGAGRLRSRLQNRRYYFCSGITWSLFGFSNFGVRFKESGFIFDVSGSSLFPPERDVMCLLAFLCSNVAFYFLSATAPTVNFQVGNIADLPVMAVPDGIRPTLERCARENIALARADWDERETSFDFRMSPLCHGQGTRLSDVLMRYLSLREERRQRMRENEETINRIFIELYGLSKEVSPYVSDRDLTLRPADAAEEIENLLSFAVMCFAGRYTPRGDAVFYPHGAMVVNEADIVGKMRAFLSACYSPDTVEENIRFIENTLGMSLKVYFLKKFYKNHVKRYQGCPILLLLTDGKTRFYLPLHDMPSVCRSLDRLPIDDVCRTTLQEICRTVDPDDGFAVNREKFSAFLV